MKFLLAMHMNPEIWDGLPEADKDEVMTGHGEFIRLIRESGELVSTQALGGPEQSAVVRVTRAASRRSPTARSPSRRSSWPATTSSNASAGSGRARWPR